MLKSLEDYLAGLSFEPPETQGDKPELDSGERAFVEKYLGIDMLDHIANPEPVPLPALQPIDTPPQVKWELKPDIIVAQPELQVAPAAKTEIIVVPDKVPEKIESVAETQIIAETVTKAETAVDAPLLESDAVQTIATATVPVEAPAAEQAVIKTAAPVETAPVEKTATMAEQVTAVAETDVATKVEAAPAEISEREKLRQADQIQAVSFFVAGQLFLLPVIGIQEVLRHMELVKVPQAPGFIAGAINLRGSVMPLIHLSALLTTSSSWTYDERSFIIVTGAQGMQMGLIIDKVSSMHMIPQQKIIWNVESKLGEAGEFLSALVDLDDRVCGMIAPDIIKQKLFAEF